MNLGQTNFGDWDNLSWDTSLQIGNVSDDFGLIFILLHIPEEILYPTKSFYFTNFLVTVKADLEKEVVDELLLLESDFTTFMIDQLLTYYADLTLDVNDSFLIESDLITDFQRSSIASLEADLMQEKTAKIFSLHIPIKSFRMSKRKLKKLRKKTKLADSV